MKSIRVAVVVAASLCLQIPGPASGAGDAAKAKRHNDSARRLFDLGMFRQAAVEYRKAYRAKPVPDLLYNLTQCHMRMSSKADLDQAVHYLESYRNDAPFSPIRAHVEKEKEIKRVRKRIARLGRKKEAPPPAPFYERWWFWTALGAVAVAGATAGTIVALQPDDPVVGTADPGISYLPISSESHPKIAVHRCLALDVQPRAGEYLVTCRPFNNNCADEVGEQRYFRSAYCCSHHADRLCPCRLHRDGRGCLGEWLVEPGLVQAHQAGS